MSRQLPPLITTKDEGRIEYLLAGNSNSKKAVCVVKVGASLDLSFSRLITAFEAWHLESR